eukprot:1507525-Rhodomonas_salina.2
MCAAVWYQASLLLVRPIPCALHPTLDTLHPTLYTLPPKPQTPDPRPQTPDRFMVVRVEWVCCYERCGTEVGYGGTRSMWGGARLEGGRAVACPISLRESYGMAGTLIVYDAMRSGSMPYLPTRTLCAVSPHAKAMPCAVLTSRMIRKHAVSRYAKAME